MPRGETAPAYNRWAVIDPALWEQPGSVADVTEQTGVDVTDRTPPRRF